MNKKQKRRQSQQVVITGFLVREAHFLVDLPPSCWDDAVRHMNHDLVFASVDVQVLQRDFYPFRFELSWTPEKFNGRRVPLVVLHGEIDNDGTFHGGQVSVSSRLQMPGMLLFLVSVFVGFFYLFCGIVLVFQAILTHDLTPEVVYIPLAAAVPGLCLLFWYVRDRLIQIVIEELDSERFFEQNPDRKQKKPETL